MLAKTVSRMEVAGRRLCMLTTPGNRTPEHFDLIAKALSGVFDVFVCYDLVEDRRGRAPGEIAALLSDALRSNGVDAAAVQTAFTYEDGLELMARAARPGDLVMILGGPERRELPW